MRIELAVLFAAAGLWLLASSQTTRAAESSRTPSRDIDIVRDRLFASLTEVSDAKRKSAIEAAERFLRTLQTDGSWSDQDYADTDRERWKCIAHLSRTISLATAAHLSGIPDDQRERFTEAAVRSLAFWLKADPTNTNWWHNEIGVPLQVGHALILLGSDAPTEVRRRGVELMKRSKWETWTGQNLVWGTRIQIIRACVTGDLELARQAFDRMYDEVRVNPGRIEGIKPDWSFYQHGELLYSGGYGSSFTSDTARLALLARETSLAIPAEKLELIVRHLLDGQAWMTRGQYWDYGVTGRELVRPRKSARSLATPARDLAILYPQRADEFRALAARVAGEASATPMSGNRHFWCSDYMVHQRPTWFASARMYSARTKSTDPLINGESRRSHFLAEGATYIMRSGGEYEEIFPVWDWHKIPGTTVEQNTPFDPRKVSRIGKERFVGGVSDGEYGCATMDLSTDALSARKSWFFFDEGFVALGADITCGTANPVVTTINQCLGSGELVSDADRWFWHDSVGYIPLVEGMSLHVTLGKQQGSWQLIDAGTSAAPVERDVMLAYIDHGAKPSAAGYAYFVAPAIAADKMPQLASNCPVRVLSNTPALQAVRHDAAGIGQAIFRQPGTVQFGDLAITVDRPCALLAREKQGSLILTASNPLNEPLVVNAVVTTDGRSEKTVRFDLPGELAAGSSVTIAVDAR